jgi:hypothetical protein
MITIDEIPIITVPVTHYKLNNLPTEAEVDFKVYRVDKQFRAIPLMSREERLMTGLPEELIFAYFSHCITTANDMEDESLNAIKQIIQELEARELL